MPRFMDIINENGETISHSTREKIHESGWWHRGVHVLVFNHKGEMLLQKRSPSKDKFPDCYDVSVSEHLQTGEQYSEAAFRGLEEELGIKDVEMERLLKFKLIYGDMDRKISEIYQCTYCGTLKINKDEVKRAEFIEVNKIKQMLLHRENEFALWAREILKWYYNLPSSLENMG